MLENRWNDAMSARGDRKRERAPRYLASSASGGGRRNRAMVTWGMNLRRSGVSPARSECASHRLGERDELGLRRCAGPEHAGSAARGETPETVQLHPERGRGHVPQRGLDSVLRGTVYVADEREGQVQAVLGQPAGVAQAGLQLTNGLRQRLRQLECDKQTWHGSLLRTRKGLNPSVWPGRTPPKALDGTQESGDLPHAIRQ